MWWWYGKGNGVSGVEVIVKEELCEKVVEVRMVNDRVMVVVLVFEKDVQSGRRLEENIFL